MKSCEGTGKNIEQAIQNALLELKASREDVDIKILSEGGFLKKAKVLVTISQDALEKYEKREELKKSLAEEENDEDFAEKFINKRVSEVEKEIKKEQKEIEKTEKKADKEEEKQEKKVKVYADEEISDSKPDKIEKISSKKISGEDFLKGVLEAMNLKGEIEVSEDERFAYYKLFGEGLNDLIGHHGECMLSLSYLMNLVCKNEGRKKISLDVENYRQKRAESLTTLAHRIANKVAKSGRYYRLEPMDASERKIIHTALQDDDRVTTMSKGEDPHRYLIVFPREYRED